MLPAVFIGTLSATTYTHRSGWGVGAFRVTVSRLARSKAQTVFDW